MGRISSAPRKPQGDVGDPQWGELSKLLNSPRGACSPSSALPRGFSSPACDSAAEGPPLVFLSLEQGLSLHQLNFSFAAEFLSPNDLMGSRCWFSEWGWVTLRTAVQDSLQRILDSKEDF